MNSSLDRYFRLILKNIKNNRHDIPKFRNNNDMINMLLIIFY